MFIYILNGNTNIGDFMRILIIGGTSGIGYYVAKSLEKRGHKVIIGTHTKGECNNLKKKIKMKDLI